MRSGVLNRTGRLRLLHKDCLLEHDVAAGEIRILPMTNLGRWLPKILDEEQDNAAVFLDISCTMFLERSNLGELKTVVDSTWTGERVSIPNSAQEGTSFKAEILVISTKHGQRGGRILARAEPRSFRIGQGGVDESPIGVEPRDLGDQVWLLEFPDDSGPVLFFNNKITDWATVVRDDRFRATAMQSILHQVFQRIATHDVGEPWMEEWVGMHGSRDWEERPKREEGEEGEQSQDQEFFERCDQWARSVTEIQSQYMGKPGNHISLCNLIGQAAENAENYDAG